MPPLPQQLDPDSDAGRAAAEALTAFLASVRPIVAAERRARAEAQAAGPIEEQKAA